jgi:hypothetical protein
LITAVDSNVLLDVLSASGAHGEASRAALEQAMAQGSLTACEVVWAEVTAFFSIPEQAVRSLDRLGVMFSPLTKESALMAGLAWRGYRNRGGRRSRLIADFLVAAHALTQADRLLTRDRGFYRSIFGKLSILDPSRG